VKAGGGDLTGDGEMSGNQRGKQAIRRKWRENRRGVRHQAYIGKYRRRLSIARGITALKRRCKTQRAVSIVSNVSMGVTLAAPRIAAKNVARRVSALISLRRQQHRGMASSCEKAHRKTITPRL